MRTHEIVCNADGWSYRVNGVDKAHFPTWHLALQEARRTAQREVLEGIIVCLRYQRPDDKMKDIPVKLRHGFDVFGGRRTLDLLDRHAVRHSISSPS